MSGHPAIMAGIIPVQSSDYVINTLEDAYVEDKNMRINLLNSYRGTGIGLTNNQHSYRATKIRCFDDASDSGNKADKTEKEEKKSTYRKFISRFSRDKSANKSG